jgi:hypothetical protein
MESGQREDPIPRRPRPIGCGSDDRAPDLLKEFAERRPSRRPNGRELTPLLTQVEAIDGRGKPQQHAGVGDELEANKDLHASPRSSLDEVGRMPRGRHVCNADAIETRRRRRVQHLRQIYVHTLGVVRMQMNVNEHFNHPSSRAHAARRTRLTTDPNRWEGITAARVEIRSYPTLERSISAASVSRPTALRNSA